MGSGISRFANEGVDVCSARACLGLGDLPESCISSVLMCLDPPEICKLARINRAFRCASSADVLWESKLPSNYKFLVHRILGGNSENLPKKDIYARLCLPNYFDDGTKEFRLEKIGREVCLSISYKAMKITGIDDRRYWNHIQTEESRFHTVAYLQQIWWVEVVGELEFQFLPGTYSLYFRLQLGKTTTRFGRRACNLDQVHGWDIKPVRFKLSTSNGQHAMSECYLYGPGNWVQYHVGDFFLEKENSSNPMRIKFSMIQIDCTHTKGGLCIDSALICPKGAQ